VSVRTPVSGGVADVIYAVVGAAVVVCCTFGLRAIPGFVSDQEHSLDESFHLYYMDEIREAGHRIPSTYSRMLPTNVAAYPALMHWSLSFLDRRTVERVAHYFGAVVDTVHVVVVMVLSWWLFDAGLLGTVPPVEGALLAGFVFAVTPRLVIGRPITSRLWLSARPLGALFVTTSAGLFLLWVETGAWPAFVGAAVLVGATFLASLFSTQVLWFLCPTLALALGSLTPLGLLVTGFAAALALSRGWYLTVLRAHLWHLRYWMRFQFDPEFASPLTNVLVRAARGESVREHLLAARPRSVTDFAKTVYMNPVTGLYLQLPFLVFAGIYAATVESPSRIAGALVAWVAFALVVDLLISLPGLRFLGDADRYAEYVVAPLSAMTVATYYVDLSGVTVPVVGTSLGPLLPWLLGAAVVYSVALVAFNVYVHTVLSRNSDVPTILSWLQDLPAGQHVLTVPTSMGKQFLSETDHRYVFYMASFVASPEGREEYATYFRSFGRPIRDLATVGDRYDLDYYVFTESALSGDEYDFSSLSKVFETDEAVVYERRTNE